MFLAEYFMKRPLSAWSLALCLGACSAPPPPLTPLPEESLPPNTTPLAPEVEAQLWSVQGREVVDGEGTPVVMRGIAFGNEVWNHTAIPSAHHTGRDFATVAAMGMNSVRFYLSYRTFEDDAAPFVYKEAGWSWLDQNVEWAKRHGVRLVLNMHAPVGGYQSQGKGSALWEDEEAQERFIALWRAIAERYRAEPTVVGFGILNEPVPVKSIAQWKALAERTIEQIRQVNQHHIVFVERASAVGGDWSENAERNFFRVSDPNVVYEFHFYKPYHFTHQNAAWSDFAAREGWYPDDSIPEVEWFQLKTEGVAHSESLPAGDSDWTMLETEPFSVYEGGIKLGKPFLVCDAGQGEVTFDSLSLTRLTGGQAKRPAPPPVVAPVPPSAKPAQVSDLEISSRKLQPGTASPKSGKQEGEAEVERELETLFEVDLDTRRGWYFWSQNGSGRVGTSPEGHGDATALFISGTTGAANLGSDPLRFRVEAGSEYQLQGLAKAKGLAEGSECRLRLEFYSSRVPVHGRNRAYLKSELDAYLSWGEKEDVPLYLGEFGTIRDSFLPGRGGEKWVADMLDLLKASGLSFAYHTYHEKPFGLYVSDGMLPMEGALNRNLFDVFVEKLEGKGLSDASVPRSAPNVELEPTPPPEQGIVEGAPVDSFD